LKTAVSKIRQARRREAWNIIEAGFIECNKALEALLNMQIPVPAVYIKAVADLENHINSGWERRSAIDKESAKALTTLRKRFKDFLRDKAKLVKMMEEYRKDPVVSPPPSESEEEEESEESEDEESEEESDESEEEPKKRPVPAKAAPSINSNFEASLIVNNCYEEHS
jgi:hypothetical protein